MPSRVPDEIGLYSKHACFLPHSCFLLGFSSQLVVDIVPQNASSGNVSVFIIGLAHLILHDAFVGSGVNEFTFSQIDAYMGYSFSIRVEENEVAWAQVFFRNPIAFFVLAFGAVREIDAEFSEYIRGKSGAIEPFLSRARPLVRGSFQAVHSRVQRGLGEGTSYFDA